MCPLQSLADYMTQQQSVDLGLVCILFVWKFASKLKQLVERIKDGNAVISLSTENNYDAFIYFSILKTVLFSLSTS